MVPVEGSIDRPAGSRAADHDVIVAVVDVSVAVSVRGAMGEPDVDSGLAGVPTDTTLVTVHVNVEVAAKPALSVAVTVTSYVPAVVGVPVMDPVPGSTDRPGGRVPPSE
jgi:hypothetical protein